jgi:hypothetical protein
MLVEPDRRHQDRRTDARVEEPLDRKAPRRQGDGDRREASRTFRNLLVRSSASPLPVPHRASLSLEGARWATYVPPPDDVVSLEFKLPDLLSPVQVSARIERRSSRPDGKTDVYAAFTGLDVRAELALARFIEGRNKLASVTAR